MSNLRRLLPLLALLTVFLVVAGCGKSNTPYNISGRVIDLEGNGVPDATVSCGSFGTATTDADGYWSKTGVQGRVTVTAAKDYWSFRPNPMSVSAAATNLEFEGRRDQVVFVASQNISGSTYTIKIANLDGTGAVTSIYTPDPSTRETGGTCWSTDGTKIAFHTIDGAGHCDIYIMNPDGTGLVRITDGTQWFKEPGWSPDGTSIVAYKGDYTLWIMNVAPNQSLSNMTQLALPTNRLGTAPDWSPDGQGIVYKGWNSGDSGTNVWAHYRLAGPGEQNVCLTPDFGTSQSVERPKWSRDGSKVLFRLSTHLAVVDMSNTVTHINAAGIIDHEFGCWATTGNRIVFSGSSTPAGDTYRYRIYIINQDGTELDKRIDTGDYYVRYPSCSPPIAP